MEGLFYPILISIGFFLAAYLLYTFLLFIFRRFSGDEGLLPKFVEKLRYPVLVIFLEIATIASINILGLKEHREELINHAILVVIIATVGWVVGTLIQVTYHHIIHKYDRANISDVSLRSTITEIHLIYRLVMFILTVVILAIILMTFPKIKALGIGILGSAGIAGLALGIAARPILLNLMAGFQIALTKTINLGDNIVIDGESCRIENIYLTHVIATTWDQRRLIIPISLFIDRTFQNWDMKSTELIGPVFMRCDWAVPVDVLRKKFYEILETTSLWNRHHGSLQVTDCSEHTVELRLTMSANDVSTLFDLKCYVREKMVAFLHDQQPSSLPNIRLTTVDNVVKK